MNKSGRTYRQSRAALADQPPVRIRIKGIQGNVVSFGSPGPADHVWRKQLKAALGTVSDAFVDMALHHLERAARMPGARPVQCLDQRRTCHHCCLRPPKRDAKPPWRYKRPART